MKTSKEIADELDAQERLLARGYIKEPCQICKGTGKLNAVNLGYVIECRECEGRGFAWKGPITK